MTMSDTSEASSLSVRPEPAGDWRQVAARITHAPGVLPAVTLLLILLIWEGACRLFAIPSFVLPAPTRILGGFGAVDTARWLEHVWATLRVAMIGYFVSIAISLPVSIMLARSEILSRAIYPILVVVQATPVVAVAPVIIVALGSSDLPRVVITCLIAF